jgi:hypothetical protein
VRDLNSSNGTYLNGSRIDAEPLPTSFTLQLGASGPVIFVQFKDVPAHKETQADTIEAISDHYFSETATAQAGERTMMVRRAFQQVKKRQSRRYLLAIAVVLVLLLASSGIGLYHYTQLRKAKLVAIEIFYSMKSLSLQITQIEDLIQRVGESRELKDDIAAKRKQLTAMEDQYNQFIDDFGIIGREMDEVDRIIIQVARLFGECEVNMPEGFIEEVKKYIAKWQKTDRLARAVQRIEKNNYAPHIVDVMQSNGLTPHFIYLGLQESDYRRTAVGPPTRFGIAKGIWQFIPSTAKEYGLRVGPLSKEARYDPSDERFNFQAATNAAGRFLRDLYKTDAQASGLLVMASYNWGFTRVRKRIQQMPDHPKDRNFWQLLQNYKIPKETYDYVFYIFSAAVIGENPQLFGFQFQSPLKGLTVQAEAAAAITS